MRHPMPECIGCRSASKKCLHPHMCDAETFGCRNASLHHPTHIKWLAWRRQSITKIQLKDREQPPVEKNYTDLDKVLSELFRPLVKNYLPLFSVVFSSLKRHTFTSKNRLPLIGSTREEWDSEGKIYFYTFPCTADDWVTLFPELHWSVGTFSAGVKYWKSLEEVYRH